MSSQEKGIQKYLMEMYGARCYFSCPVYHILGKDWGQQPYGGSTGAMWTAIVNKDYMTATYCTHSGGCKEVCPMKIDIPKVLEYIKWQNMKR